MFATVFTYNFDPEVQVFLFATEDKAIEFLRETYNEEFRIETEENGWDSEGKHSDDWWHAEIEYGGDICYYDVVVVQDMRK